MLAVTNSFVNYFLYIFYFLFYYRSSAVASATYFCFARVRIPRSVFLSQGTPFPVIEKNAAPPECIRVSDNTPAKLRDSVFCFCRFCAQNCFLIFSVNPSVFRKYGRIVQAAYGNLSQIKQNKFAAAAGFCRGLTFRRQLQILSFHQDRTDRTSVHSLHPQRRGDKYIPARSRL